MLKKLFTYCLCFILSFPGYSYAESSQSSYSPDSTYHINQLPDKAKVIHVQPGDYPQLAAQLYNQGYRPSSTHLASNETPPDKSQSRSLQTNSSTDCNKDSSSASEESIEVMIDFSNDMFRSSSNSNNDAAPLIFVVIGTIVVIAWALYVFKYIYDISTGIQPCGYWSQLTFRTSRITGAPDHYAKFRGIKYMTGFRDALTEIGISIELGHADILIPTILNTHLKGNYIFLGPVLRWRISNITPHYFSMSFLAGSTEHDKMGLIAQANAGFQFALNKHTHIGLSWGAMNIDVNEDQGIAQNQDDYFYLYGINFGFDF